MEQQDKLCLEGIYRQGYGLIPKFVMHDPSLTLESKAVYAYLCSLAGSGDVTFPYRETILRHTGLSKNTYYRHYGLLLEQGYLSVTRPADKTAANIYTLVQNPKKLSIPPAKGEEGRLGYRGLKALGYGSIPRAVMLDERISIKAKGLYAYFCSYCGGGDCAFPRRDDILFHLGISEPTYYKALAQLKDAGYIEIEQRKQSGRFTVNDYYLTSLKLDTHRGQIDSPSGTMDALPQSQANLIPFAPNEDKGTSLKLDTTLGNIGSHTNTKKTSSQVEATPQRSAPVEEQTPTESTARDVCSFKLPYPKIWDIEKWDTKIGDTKTCDGKYNNSSSNNSFSNTSPSIDPTDGQVVLRVMVLGLIEELACRPPRKNQTTALAAREYLRHACKTQGGEASFFRLQEEFVAHFGAGLQGKKVRNLKAYCKTALYNWLAEQPLRAELGRQSLGEQSAASYDMGTLERLLETGEL